MAVSSEGELSMAQSNWSAQDPVKQAQLNRERADRQAKARAEDRRAEVIETGRGRRRI